MKFLPAAIVLIIAGATTASATRVRITPHCSGVDFAKASLLENSQVGEILQASFNKVHEDYDGVRLTGINVDLHQDDTSKLGFEFRWNGNYVNLGIDGSDANAMDAASENYVDQWEAQFVNLLLATRITAFHRVGQCQIKVEPESDDAHMETLQTATDIHVTIEAKCHGVNFYKIPLSQDIFVGHLLQHTFNHAHPDEHLSNVKFGLRASTTASSFFGWSGDYGCNECKRDDSFHAHWEEGFSKALQTSQHKDFAKAGKCYISMKAAVETKEEVKVLEAAFGATKCGLRGCAEI